MVRISCEGKIYNMADGATPGDLWDEVRGSRRWNEAVLARCGGEVMDFLTPFDGDTSVTWISMKEKYAYLASQRMLTMLLVAAVKELGGMNADVEVKHSLGQGLYCEFPGHHTVTHEELALLEARMKAIALEKRPLRRITISKDDAVAVLKKRGADEEADLLADASFQRFGVYQCGRVTDYYFGPMLPDMGYVPPFRLVPYAPGFLLLFPAPGQTAIAPYKEEPLFARVFLESERWGALIGCRHVRDLNQAIRKGQAPELIAAAEALHEKKLAYLADRICREDPPIRMICIAGPSSAGKTTFMKRLITQLRVNGVRPVMISLDDYYRDHRSYKANETVNFENLSSLDIGLFEKTMAGLLEGKAVRLPQFDFLTGHRQWDEKEIILPEDQPVLVEGLHGLNPELTHFVPGYQCIHIYLGALTQLSINNHNRISTTDTRLLRRLVRDARTRGNSAEITLARWDTVRRGEEQNIFYFQDRADVIFNTALIYELPVLKKAARPLLEAVPRSSMEYAEARRLLQSLEPFAELGTEDIPQNSILREFVG